MFQDNISFLDYYSKENQSKILHSLSLRGENVSERIFNSLLKKSRGWNNVLRLGCTKIHQHSKPKNIGVNAISKGIKHLAFIVNKHNFQMNKKLIYKRIEKKMRVNIRSEREEAYKALSMVLLKYIDLDLFGVGLFEIKAPIEVLAREIGVFYKTSNNKVHYDILLKAMKDFEEVKYLIIHRSKDELSKSYKSSRIWLTPDFFNSVGFSNEELRKLVLNRYNYISKKNRKKHYSNIYNEHLIKLNRHGIVDLPISLNNLLIKIKKKLLGQFSDPEMINEKKEIEKHDERSRLARLINKNKNKSIDANMIFHNKLAEYNFPPVDGYIIQNKIKKLFPDKAGDDFWITCLAELDLKIANLK